MNICITGEEYDNNNSNNNKKKKRTLRICAGHWPNSLKPHRSDVNIIISSILQMGELRLPHLGNLSSYMPCKWQNSWLVPGSSFQHLCYMATLMTALSCCWDCQE